MLKDKDRRVVRIYNVIMLIATCITLPLWALGVKGGGTILFNSNFTDVFTVYVPVIIVAFIACLIIQIVTIILLK